MIASFMALIGRLLIAAYFVIDGAGKLVEPTAVTAVGGSGLLGDGALTGLGIAQIILGLALALGIALRTVSLLLIVVTLVIVMFILRPYTDPLVGQIALLNIALIGGLLGLFAYGQVHWSLDAIRARRREDIARRDATIAGRDDQLRHRDAELSERDAQLRAVRNDGRADAVTAADVPPAQRPLGPR
jgi:putative oxidoreductase